MNEMIWIELIFCCISLFTLYGITVNNGGLMAGGFWPGLFSLEVIGDGEYFSYGGYWPGGYWPDTPSYRPHSQVWPRHCRMYYTDCYTLIALFIETLPWTSYCPLLQDCHQPSPSLAMQPGMGFLSCQIPVGHSTSYLTTLKSNSVWPGLGWECSWVGNLEGTSGVAIAGSAGSRNPGPDR